MRKGTLVNEVKAVMLNSTKDQNDHLLSFSMRLDTSNSIYSSLKPIQLESPRKNRSLSGNCPLQYDESMQ